MIAAPNFSKFQSHLIAAFSSFLSIGHSPKKITNSRCVVFDLCRLVAESNVTLRFYWRSTEVIAFYVHFPFSLLVWNSDARFFSLFLSSCGLRLSSYCFCFVVFLFTIIATLFLFGQKIYIGVAYTGWLLLNLDANYSVSIYFFFYFDASFVTVAFGIVSCMNFV